MKYLKLLVVAAMPLIFANCSGGGGEDEPEPEDTFKVQVLSPVKVTKTEDAKIYVHLMPWFEDKTTSSNGKWGQHWTMANRNPDIKTDDVRRQIASHFYPMIGPYASSDKFVIEYQTLMMKFAGIDGVVIDWYGTTSARDYPANAKNTSAFIAQTSKAGLEFALVYEDQSVKHAYDDKVITDKLMQGKTDMSHLSSNYFSKSNYIKIDGKPLLMAFGPQEFQTEESWTSVFSVLSTKPKFLALWGQSGEAGANAAGEFAWVYQTDAQSHAVYLDNFYNSEYEGLKMGSAYPGFKDYYQQGGWGANYFNINHNGTGTLKLTLDKAQEAGVDYIQIATWNDYGEGTMIEPTIEFGYSLLTLLQTELGTTTKQAALELVTRLYNARVRFKDDGGKQKRLSQVYYYLVALKFDEAEKLLDEVD